MAHSWQVSYSHALCCSCLCRPTLAAARTEYNSQTKPRSLEVYATGTLNASGCMCNPRCGKKTLMKHSPHTVLPTAWWNVQAPPLFVRLVQALLSMLALAHTDVMALLVKTPTGTPRRIEAVKSVWLPSPAATHMMGKHTAAPCHISLLAPVPAITQAATTCCIAPWHARGHTWVPS